MQDHDQRLRFRRASRLTHAREFQAVYKNRIRAARGGLLVFGLPNGLNRPRLGLAVSKQIGNAVARSHAKRLIREAFRHVQHELPHFDYVVRALPGRGLTMSGCQTDLLSAAEKLERLSAKRASKSKPTDASDV